MRATNRLAAIDIGTVTTRLLVADVGPSSIIEVERSTDITHLGKDVALSGRLSAEGMERVESVVARYAVRMRELGVEAWRAVATSASRDAENAAEFTRMLAAHGIEPEVIAGDIEARLMFAGATYGHAVEGVLVNDIGGGSTELVLGDSVVRGGRSVAKIEVACSADVGSRRLTDLMSASDPPTREELATATTWVRERITPFFATLSRQPSTCIALAGTATTVSAIHQGLVTYDPMRVHGSVLSVDDIHAVFERLAALPVARRATEVVGLHPGRAAVIVAGILILLVILECAQLDSTLVSEHDILYGMLLDVYSRLESDARGDFGLE
ncbi:MAG: hypothetical protein RBS78_01140 [Coriobacteriia bacterium]|jgi:exopolyphosphatase/guanosine-5'-triphosphate,3'-diphosphate pyrophosphatase|nr:hypothetical protein [Coriobacteriia bacterium]